MTNIITKVQLVEKLVNSIEQYPKIIITNGLAFYSRIKNKCKKASWIILLLKVDLVYKLANNIPE